MKRDSLQVPRFIVGMGRAGTTWLSKCLNEHPDVAVFGEPFFGVESSCNHNMGVTIQAKKLWYCRKELGCLVSFPLPSVRGLDA